MSLEPIIQFEFNYKDKVLNKIIKYAEIKLPPKNIKIKNISFPFRYIYDTPMNEINNPKYYKLPFKYPNINFINMYRIYNQKIYDQKKQRKPLNEYNYIMNSMKINRYNKKGLIKFITKKKNSPYKPLPYYHLYNFYNNNGLINKDNKKAIHVVYMKIKYNNKNNINRNRDIFQQYIKNVKK